MSGKVNDMKTMHKSLEKIKSIGYGSLSILLFLALWEVLVDVKVLNGVIVPSPMKVIRAVVEMVRSGLLFNHASVSLQRAGYGFSLSFVIAIPLGFLMGGLFKKLGEVLIPLFKLMEKINPFALFPVFMMLLGITETSKIAMIFWVSQWPIFFNTLVGIRSIDPLLIKSARSMGAGSRTVFFKVILPAALPNIFTGLKVGAQVAFFVVVSAELLGSSRGLGYLIFYSMGSYMIPQLFGAAICISILGVIINKIFALLEKRFLVWKEAAFEINEG